MIRCGLRNTGLLLDNMSMSYWHGDMRMQKGGYCNIMKKRRSQDLLQRLFRIGW
jgi:hypothetical protein